MSKLASTQSPSQTVGPFFHPGLVFGGENVLVSDGVRGERIVLAGQVLDGDGAVVPDALIEIWQADAAGIYAHAADPQRGMADANFCCYGRSDTRHAGNCYRFETVKPGRIAAPGGGWQAPHVNVHIFSRGVLTHLATRIYFADEMDANAVDPTLVRVETERRKTLVAVREPGREKPAVYRLDFVLQGPGETVFFEP
jgi:protocatechuate 3,4-dioxygenase, alpha subunit